MTRYLESWGAAKPFANLHHRDSMTTDNGKINTTVSITPTARSCMRKPGVSQSLNDVTFPGRSNGPVSLPEERKVSAAAAASASLH